MSWREPIILEDATGTERPNAEEIRRLFAEGPNGGSGEPGIVAPGQFEHTANAGTNEFTLTGGSLWIDQTTDTITGGQYWAHNDGNENVAIPASDPTNDTIHYIVAQVDDNAEDSGGNNRCRYRVISGNPAASPDPPDVSAEDNFYILKEVLQPAGEDDTANMTVTDRREYYGGYRSNREVVQGGSFGGSNAIPTAGETYMSDDLEIPADWETYEVRAWATYDTDDISATGSATIIAQLRWNGTQVSRRSLITLNNNTVDSRRGVAIVGRSVGETATGTITGELFHQVNAQNNAYKADNGDFIVEAIKTNLNLPVGSSGQPA